MASAVGNPALLVPGVGTVVPAPSTPAPPAVTAPAGPSFDSILREQLAPVSFSKHALQRIERRGIDIGDGTLQRLQAGVARAEGKGARDAVVLVDETAFVVSVRNRTVITAVDQEHMREQVFTNIDSAVFA